MQYVNDNDNNLCWTDLANPVEGSITQPGNIIAEYVHSEYNTKVQKWSAHPGLSRTLRLVNWLVDIQHGRLQVVTGAQGWKEPPANLWKVGEEAQGRVWYPGELQQV